MTKIREAFDRAERIGVIGSPSSTGGLTIDVLGTAIDKRLVGNLSVFQYTQDGKDHYALGQITEITMENVWSQDPTMKSIIRQKGRVDPITERQDTHKANMMVSSVFSMDNELPQPSILGTVPCTGTSIKQLDENILNTLLANYKEELFYLGKAYGTNILMPMWLKHFGSGNHGAGEAYHIGVFGKTGSGKSILASMMMTGYAEHESMSIFVLDPQGQFSREFKKPEMNEIIGKKLNRTVEIISLHNLVLTGDELLKRILTTSKFFTRWCRVVYIENQERAADQVLKILKGSFRGQSTLSTVRGKIPPWDAHKREVFDMIWDILLTNQTVQSAIYTSKETQQSMVAMMQSQNVDEVYDDWQKITNLFAYTGKTNKKEIKGLVQEIVERTDSKGKIIIIDLSETSVPNELFWNDEIKYIVIGEFLSQLIKQAEEQYRKEKLLNTLVILDEAHRLAPRDKSDNDNLEEVKATLIDAIRTTRKYGLGWMFISQTLSSLDKEIINQIRVFVFGFGLAWGLEQQALREIIGGNKEAIKLYQMFRDPQSSLGEKEYSFMTIGPISPLSFSGAPLFFTSLRYPTEFLKLNYG